MSQQDKFYNIKKIGQNNIDNKNIFCYNNLRRLGFCGKSERENASWTESAFEMSSKLGNTPFIYSFILKADAFLSINAGGTAG